MSRGLEWSGYSPLREASSSRLRFLKAQPLISTKYAVLMHNDAYPMERDFACEMFRALEAHPHYPIAAPQIYEVAEDGIIVPRLASKCRQSE